MRDPRELAYKFITNNHVMTLATMGKGGVWASAVFYNEINWKFQFLSAKHTRHAQNIAQNGQISASIQENVRNWRDIHGIQMEGFCTELLGNERDLAIKSYIQRFPNINDEPQLAQALTKMSWYEFIPEKLLYIDNSVRLGHRDVIVDNGSEVFQ